jgi:hypothetical protein
MRLGGLNKSQIASRNNSKKQEKNNDIISHNYCFRCACHDS